jgi:hypothetical protein
MGLQRDATGDLHPMSRPKYSDGTLLNAKRYEYSVFRNVSPETAGEYAAITDNIAGAAAYRTADLSALSEDELAALRDAVQVQALDAAGNPCADYEQADCLTVKIGLDGNRHPEQIQPSSTP